MILVHLFFSPVARRSPPDSPVRRPRPRPRQPRLPAWCSPMRRPGPWHHLPGSISSPPCRDPRPRPRRRRRPAWSYPTRGSIHRFRDDVEVALGGQRGGHWRRGPRLGWDSKAGTRGHQSRQIPTASSSRATGNARFANSTKLLAKTPTLLAKDFPTGFSSSCGKELLAF
jgi:hypothetical protein